MKNYIRMIIFVVVMGTVSGSLLMGVNALTAVRIAKNEELKLKTAVLDALEIAYTKADVLSIFDAQVSVAEKAGNTFYKASDGSIAFKFNGPGLWGSISGIISLENDLKTIRKIKVLFQEETPGLGSRIAETDYLNQFKKKEVVPRLIFMPEGKAKEKNEVDSITGATGSSRAFEGLINDTVQKYLTALG